MLVHLRHKWVTVETIDRVKTKRCAICGKTKIRFRRPRVPQE